MKAVFRNIVLMALFMGLLSSCEGLFEEEILEEGSFMFWSNFDGPPIDIYIDGIPYGTITGFFTEAPGCGAGGCVTVTLEPGTYELYAVEQTNSPDQPREWNQMITIRPDICGKLGLTDN